MKEKILAKRYGEAFLSYARESMSFEKAVEEMRNLKLFLHGQEEFADFLKNPQVADRDKFNLIDMALAGTFSDEIGHLLKLLVEKGRIRSIDDICDYVRTTYSHQGAIDVLLKTTYPLDTDVIKKIQEKLTERFGRKMNFFIKFDADLLGGIQVMIGNTLIDGSIKNRLEELRARLMKAKVA